MWNGFSMISKQPELTAGILETLLEAERTLQAAPGTALHTCWCLNHYQVLTMIRTACLE